ncbi:copper amine oxidase N-terminal domain-containing protein [Paenibacillus oryzisoli]|uniref:copper amine oxidase N-terminal domain-containing protein n=1 Tax=Paenibacillus oryzisoli TaxID=1850517 RepID=UPI003D27CC7C
MARKKMTWWLSAMMAAMLMVLTGCQTIQGLDIVQALLNNATLQSASSKSSLELELVPGNTSGLSPEAKQAFDTLNHAKLEFRSVNVQDKQHMFVDGALTYGRGTIPFQVAMSGTNLTLQVEGAKKPFSFDLMNSAGGAAALPAAETTALQKELMSKMNDLIPVVMKFIIANLPNPEHISVSSVTDTVNNETLSLKKAHIEIKGSELLPLVKGFLTNMVADEKGLKDLLGQLYDILMPVIKESMKAASKDSEAPSEYNDLMTAYMDNKNLAVEFLYTTLQQLVKTQLDNWDETMANSVSAVSEPQMKALLSDQTVLQADLYMDQDKQIRKIHADLSLPIVDESSGVSAVKLAYTSEIWNINKPVKAETIDVSGGTIELKDLSGGNATGLLSSVKKDSALYKLLRNDLKVAKKDIMLILNQEGEVYYPWDSSHPFIDDSGVAMVSARYLAEQLGAEVAWDADASQITINDALSEKKVVLTLDASTAKVNGADVRLDSPAILKNGVTFVPLRFIAEQLGGKVEFDESTHSVRVTRE